MVPRAPSHRDDAPVGRRSFLLSEGREVLRRPERRAFAEARPGTVLGLVNEIDAERLAEAMRSVARNSTRGTI
jgi:hypothetical protein